MHQQQIAFENIVEKKEFLLDQKIVSPFVNIFDIISLFAAELEEHKIGVWGKGLIVITLFCHVWLQDVMESVPLHFYCPNLLHSSTTAVTEN